MITWALMTAAAAASTPVPDLGWMTGYWLSCANGLEVSETWSGPNGHSLRGSSTTVEADGRLTFEVMRISVSKGKLSYFAEPSGQPAAEFPLKSASDVEAVFENPTHDFPQRIIYRREGDQLLARIEGKMGEEDRAVDWAYAAAPLNTNCPTPPASSTASASETTAASEAPAAEEVPAATSEQPETPPAQAEPSSPPAEPAPVQDQAEKAPSDAEVQPAEPAADPPPKPDRGPVGPPEYEPTPLPPI